MPTSSVNLGSYQATIDLDNGEQISCTATDGSVSETSDGTYRGRALRPPLPPPSPVEGKPSLSRISGYLAQQRRIGQVARVGADDAL